jgi:hypothetical protein
VAGFQHGAEIFDRINRIDRISEFFDRMSGIAGWTGDLSFKWRWVERELVRCGGGFLGFLDRMTGFAGVTGLEWIVCLMPLSSI